MYVWKKTDVLVSRASIFDKRRSFVRNAGFPGSCVHDKSCPVQYRSGFNFENVRIDSKSTSDMEKKRGGMESLGNNWLELLCSAFREQLLDLSVWTWTFFRRYCHVDFFFFFFHYNWPNKYSNTYYCHKLYSSLIATNNIDR